MENLPENDHSFAMIQAQQSTGAVSGAAVTPGDFHFLTTQIHRAHRLLFFLVSEPDGM